MDETGAVVETPGGDTPVGDETIDQGQQQDQDQGQDPGQQGDRAQGQQGQQPDQRGGEFGDDPEGDERGGGRANERIRGLVDTMRTLEQRLQQFESRSAEGQSKRPAYTPDEKYAELHQGMGGYVEGYIRHMAEPIARAVVDLRQQIADITDRADFYAENAGFDARQRGMIERAKTALTEQTGQPWSRSDVVRYLRGHEKYGKRFTPADAATRGVDDRLVAARRGAARIGAPAQMRASGGQAPDLSTMSPADRVKLIESQHGNAAI